MTTGKRALPGFVREHPASFAVFDLMAATGQDTRELALSDRRALMEQFATG